jgi:hypothetical protein
LPQDGELEEFLQKWMTRAVGEYVDELRVGAAADEATESPSMGERSRQVVAGLAKRKAALRPSAPSKHVMQQVVRQFRQAMKKSTIGSR